MALYKSLKPPEYNVSRITVPTIILHSKRDNLVTKKVNEHPHPYNLFVSNIHIILFIYNYEQVFRFKNHIICSFHQI